ncbi:MFS transporter [Dehalococcoidia bacterium]|nr:MFS transporter [Dehalococcoidia bacterium]
MGAATLQAFYTSGTFFYGFGALFNPIVHEFGWTRAATAGALSLQRTEAGIAGPFVGFLVDRYGARGIMLVGTAFTAAGFYFLARIHSLLSFYLAISTIAVGLAMGAMIVTTAVVGNWFVRRRSWAMTIAFAGGGLGGISTPMLVWAITRYGWRQVVDWLGLGWLLIGIPVALIMRHRPEQYGDIPDGKVENQIHEQPRASVKPNSIPKKSMDSDDTAGKDIVEVSFTTKQILKNPVFWQLSMSMGIIGMVMSTVVVFSIPGLESFGLSSNVAALTVLFISVFNLMGRFGLGFLGDVLDKRHVLAATYLMISLGSLAFASVHQGWHVIFFLLLYPPGHGGTVPVRYALLADYFGRKSFGSLVGLNMTLTAVFGIIGPVFTGWVFDVTGSYRWAFIIMGLLALPTVPATLMVKQPVTEAYQ